MFRTEALREALAAAERPEEATDEAMLVEWNGGTVLIHPVAEQNLKVTTPLDLRVAELLLAERAGGYSRSSTKTSIAAKQTWPMPSAVPRFFAPTSRAIAAPPTKASRRSRS